MNIQNLLLLKLDVADDFRFDAQRIARIVHPMIGNTSPVRGFVSIWYFDSIVHQQTSPPSLGEWRLGDQFRIDMPDSSSLQQPLTSDERTNEDDPIGQAMIEAMSIGRSLVVSSELTSERDVEGGIVCSGNRAVIVCSGLPRPYNTMVALHMAYINGESLEPERIRAIINVMGDERLTQYAQKHFRLTA